MSDYTRFAVKPGDQVLSQVVIVPVMGVLTCLIGIICTSVAVEFYPEDGLLWQPYALLTAVQMHGGDGARAAVFFACKQHFKTRYDRTSSCKGKLWPSSSLNSVSTSLGTPYLVVLTLPLFFRNTSISVEDVRTSPSLS